MKKTIKVVFCVMLCTTLLFGCGNNNTSNFEQKTLETDDAMTFSTIEWPDTDIAKLLPVPKTLNGNINWSKDYGFVIYISGVSKEDYTDYNSQCMNAGFNIEQRDGDGFYWADNAQGYHVHTTLDGDVMFIRIDEPEDGPNLPVEESTEEVREEVESVSEEPIVEEPTTVIEEKVEENLTDTILTIDNDEKFAEIMQSTDYGRISLYVFNNEGKTIEFDGNISGVEKHKDYDTRYDVWIYTGDYSETDVYGPSFQIYDKNPFNMGFDDFYLPTYMVFGQNIHVVAKLVSFNSDTGFVIIDPISITER